MQNKINKLSGMIFSAIGIAVILLLVGVFSGNILFFGISLFMIGAIILVLVARNEVKIRSVAMIYGVYLELYGLALMTSPFVAAKFSMGDNYAVCILSVGIGGLCVITGIHNISKKWICKEQIQATFTGAARQQSSGSVYYVPRFSFTYEGKDYENTSGETYSKKRLSRKYENGKQYPIYISPANPNMFRTKGAVSVGNVLLFIIGIMFCGMAFLLFL